jgi:hypothetical protein
VWTAPCPQGALHAGSSATSSRQWRDAHEPQAPGIESGDPDRPSRAAAGAARRRFRWSVSLREYVCRDGKLDLVLAVDESVAWEDDRRLGLYLSGLEVEREQ